MSEMVGKLFGWVNSRLPVSNTFERHLSKHPVPSKVNFWYSVWSIGICRINYPNCFWNMVNNAIFKY